ncbi:hypothetical protein [Mesorhizobium sp. ANAO-SY3R2]|uniref:hypothetical protein n=1 Tax=Mesorhizobium sp. ANAO-SY3R2 TaxID=3166644 RepID=UPI0036705877
MMVRLFSESFRGHIPKYLVALSCMVIVAASTAGLAMLMRYVINYVFVEQSLVMMWGLAGSVLVISVAKGLANYTQSVILATIGNDIVATLQRRLARILAAFGDDLWLFDAGGNVLMARAFEWLARADAEHLWPRAEIDEFLPSRMTPLWADCHAHFAYVRTPPAAGLQQAVYHPDLGIAPFWTLARK